MYLVVLVSLAAVICLLLQQSHAYEYCRNKDHLCKPGDPHIVCNPSSLPMEGEFLGVVPMTSKIRNLLLNLHNKIREKTACGVPSDTHQNRFPKATRMRRLVWDYELAYVAKIHAQRCTTKQDKCRNTERFRKAGQNLGGPLPHPLELISTSVENWFSQHRLLVDGAVSVKALPKSEFELAANYTLIANDRVSRVGCAITMCRVNAKSNQFFLTCNYDHITVAGAPLYQTGKVGSKCTDWDTSLSSEYECLCENNEKIYTA